MLKAKIKLIEGGKVPVKGSEKASCYDLFARKTEMVTPDKFKVWLGIQVEPPEGYDVRLYPRSSIGKTDWVLANSVGIIDEDYRGECIANFFRVKHEDEASDDGPYKVGDRCIQMEIVRKDQVDFEIVDELSQTKRGENGFGSTGK